jgi:hypothetical protein
MVHGQAHLLTINLVWWPTGLRSMVKNCSATDCTFLKCPRSNEVPKYGTILSKMENNSKRNVFNKHTCHFLHSKKKTCNLCCLYVNTEPILSEFKYKNANFKHKSCVKLNVLS